MILAVLSQRKWLDWNVGRASLPSSTKPWNHEWLFVYTLKPFTLECECWTWRSASNVLIFCSKCPRCYKMLYCLIPAANIFIPFQFVLLCVLTPIRSFTQAGPTGHDHPLPYDFFKQNVSIAHCSFNPFPALWVVKNMIFTCRKMDSSILEMIHGKQIRMKTPALGLLQSWRCSLQFLEMRIWIQKERIWICLSQDSQGSAWSHGRQASPFLLPAYRTAQTFSASGPWLILVSDVFVEKQNMSYVHI